MLTTDAWYQYACLLSEKPEGAEVLELIATLRLTPEQVKADKDTLVRYAFCRTASMSLDAPAMEAELRAANAKADVAEAAAHEARESANALHHRFSQLSDLRREFIALKDLQIIKLLEPENY